MLPVIDQPHKRFSNTEIVSVLGAHKGHGFYALLVTWIERWQTRRAMARDLPTFTQEMLEDFGTSRKEAFAEIRKPFWRA